MKREGHIAAGTTPPCSALFFLRSQEMEEPGKLLMPSVAWPEAAGDASLHPDCNICSRFCSETKQPPGSSTQGAEMS